MSICSFRALLSLCEYQASKNVSRENYEPCLQLSHGRSLWVPKDPLAWYNTTPNNQLHQRTIPVSILSPLLEEKYSVNEIAITGDEIMVSFDVIALFTPIPVDLDLQIVREKLQRDVTLTERADVSVQTNVMKLLG